MSDLSGFSIFVEKAETPTVAGTMGDELGISGDDLSQFYSREPIMIADIKLPDGTYHSLLPVKIVPGSITDKTVTVVIDDTFSPNLNDKVLRKAGKDKMKTVPGWEREEKRMVLPLDSKTKSGASLQDILSQGWSAAAAGAGGGGDMGGMGGGLPF